MARVVRPGLDTVLLVTAATLGSLAVALLASAALARFLPMSADTRFALGFAAAVPLWVTLMCAVLLSKSGARALAVCVGSAAVLAGVLFGIAR